MAAAIGLAVALGRTPVPARVTPGVSTHGGGHNTLSWEVLPWSPGRLLTEWRPDAVVLTAVGLALVAYLVGVRRLARVGQFWPVHRTVSTMAGLAVATFALCGGLASYSTAMFSVQVTQLLVMATVVPFLLTLGMPLALVLQVRGGGGDAHVYAGLRAHMTGRTARVLGNPVNGLLLLVAFLVVLYATPLFELSLRYFTLHLFTNVLGLACGLTFFWSVLGVDVTPERRALMDRLKLVALFLLFLGAFGVVLVSGDRLYGLRWFMDLGWWWADPVVDQRRGGEVVWAFALGLAPLTVLVMWTQWRFLRVRAEADGKPRA
jgi:putative copper resistance protein D